ncbi:MAG: hypothetical protein R2873_16380, partial [Caldilineaceae bacterium]
MAIGLSTQNLTSDDPRMLEETYRVALRRGEGDSFAAAMTARYRAAPENLLYAAWFYRLQEQADDRDNREDSVSWRTALPLALLSGLLFALLADSRFAFADGAPYLLLLWSPLVAVLVYLFLMIENPAYRRRALPALGGVVAAGAYVFALATWRAGQTYQILMLFHLPLLAWIGVGFGMLGWGSSPRERFAALIKSVEIGITGGVFGIGVGAFAMITVGLFSALGLDLPE